MTKKMTTKDAIDIIKQTPIYRQEEDWEIHSELCEALIIAVRALEYMCMMDELIKYGGLEPPYTERSGNE